MKNIPLYIDLAFCIVVLPVMMIIFPVERWFHNFPWYVVSVGVWLYCLYFLNRFVTVPFLFKGKREVEVGALMIVASLVVTYCFSSVTLYTPKPSVHDFGINRRLPDTQQYQQAVWSLFMVVEAFSFAVGLLIQTNIQRSRRMEVEADKDKAEIALYKAQIKPHFMFNTLNSLYGLFLTNNPNALESLEKYISMIRYIHVTSMRDLVQLAEEVEYIREYVDLQTLRLNEKTTVSLDIDIDDEDVMVPPMLLTTFVENCFKYGVSPVEKGHISLSLRERGGKMVFTTDNRIFPVNRHGGRKGIENCRKRLGLLYPGRHVLEIKNDNNKFHVKLNIDLLA